MSPMSATGKLPDDNDDRYFHQHEKRFLHSKSEQHENCHRKPSNYFISTSLNFQQFLFQFFVLFQGRMVRNEIPTFQWTTRTSSIDWRFLQKDQIVNHFAKANFTTKVTYHLPRSKLTLVDEIFCAGWSVYESPHGVVLLRRSFSLLLSPMLSLEQRRR